MNTQISQITIAGEIMQERDRQDQKWGRQNHPSVHRKAGSLLCDITEADAKARCTNMNAAGLLTWEDIAVEELLEALEAGSEAERREELVQLAAVCVAWIECIDRRGAR
ncbi:MAG: hypothetical protein IPH07_24245 [Deltaproteobacteria bacterium]|nr:hypothetical protein [Deltaproteobacteria bacterium]